MPVLWNLENIL